MNKNDIEFSYNANLGALQERTEANLKTARILLDKEAISYEDYKKLKVDIYKYFIDQIEKIKNDPFYFIRSS